MSLKNLTANGGFVTDEKTKTVTIRQAEYTLQKDSYLPGYHLIIYASSVIIKKGYKNPGCNLTLYAAQIIVDKTGATIDVSGVDAKNFKINIRPKATGLKSGTYNGVDGINGKNGSVGQNSGAVTINAGLISGSKLQILGTGGHGGRAQDGGHAIDGKIPATQPTPKQPKKIKIKDDKVIVSEYDGSVQIIEYLDWGSDVKKFEEDGSGAYLLVAHKAKTGRTGGNGGHAGLPGVSGNGGKGAKVLINFLGSPKTPIASKVNGGKSAPTAQFGTPGKLANGGAGGKYLYKASVGFVSTDWSGRNDNSDWKNHWSDGLHIKNLKVSAPFAFTHKGVKILRVGNNKGDSGEKGGYGAKGLKSKPLVKPSIKGVDGQFMTGILNKPQLFEYIPYNYYLLLQRSAAIAVTNRDQQQAIAILQWLIFLTAPYGNESDEARQNQLIHDQSETTLLTIGREQNDNRTKRCIYTDIGDYTDFIEVLLKHVKNQSEYFHNFQASIETKKQQQKILRDAINETQQHIEELTGNTLEAGSIEYFKENEKQIKSGMGDLDFQMLNYKLQLEQMPDTLQNEIDAKYYKESQINFWNVLEFYSMAAGVVVNFASAANSILNMVEKVKSFYKEAMELTSWADILKDGIWGKSFTERRQDISLLIETSEFKNMSTNNKSFISSATDFQAKIQAYDEFLKSRKNHDIEMDILDIQASVINFDMAKLKLKLQRTDLEDSLSELVENYPSAKLWQRMFVDYFDTSNTRFDMLAHLAEVQAERRLLESQKNQYQRNIETQQAELDRLNLNQDDTDYDAARDSLQANMYLALNQGLELIMDEYRAYHIWTLNEKKFPKIQQNITTDLLISRYHDPIWRQIKTLLASNKSPASRDFSDTPHRSLYDGSSKNFKDMYFNKTNNRWRFLITLPIDTKSNIYFQRIIDAKVYLSGATVSEGSAFHCILRHRGVSNFLNRDRKEVTVYQNKRSIVFSYIVEDDKPNYDYRGAIKNPFDDDNISSIRYSPFTTWELEIIPDYKQNASSIIYNKNIDLSGLKCIELRYKAFFNSFAVGKK